MREEQNTKLSYGTHLTKSYNKKANYSYRFYFICKNKKNKQTKKIDKQDLPKSRH